MASFGDIVLVRFPFTDLSMTKSRPALVVSRHTTEDVILCFITSVPRSGFGIVPITPDSRNGLKRPSSVRFDKICTLSTSLVRGQIGVASPDWLAGCAITFHDVFGF